MTASIAVSLNQFESWMRDKLGDEIVESDLDEKHRKMRKGPFPFLRATYWRWAEGILEVCPELADAPTVLAIGDTHLENFGTWRDAEGRLVWGANDFDEAANMPYALDLVRLGASALLARPAEVGASELCDALVEGYIDGLDEPKPVVLEKDYAWLRSALVLSESERADFWGKFDRDDEPIPVRFAHALGQALPKDVGHLRRFARSSGTGSLGKPRFVANASWQGGPVLREAKAVLQSSWCRAHDPAADAILAGVIADGPFRARDPHYAVLDGVVVRRLSPNSRKIEAKDASETLLSSRMVKLMGKEVANCHGTDPGRLNAVREDLGRRGRGWLKAAAEKAASWVEQEQRAYV
ncbi:DUF2252 family protein [Novosphingobium sp. BL-8A]|uniref:DUF2252 family protein n=1 Tax=Novosphingobium sp. BL-8A TaxID=3127639 RepID=UPI003757AEAA